MSDRVREKAAELTRPPVLVGPDETLQAVAEKLWENDIGAAVVARGRDLLGVVSERDITAQIARGADPAVATAERAMSHPVVAAHADDPMMDVAFLMIDEMVRHVPVIDDNGDVTGMVSIRALVRPLLLDALGG